MLFFRKFQCLIALTLNRTCPAIFVALLDATVVSCNYLVAHSQGFNVSEEKNCEINPACLCMYISFQNIQLLSVPLQMEMPFY